jgi:hypothetical protein
MKTAAPAKEKPPLPTTRKILDVSSLPDAVSPGKQKGSNSLEIFREKWQRQLVQHKDIPAGVLKVALVIGWHINRNSRIAFPGMRTISRLAALSTSTVNSAIKWLAKNRYLHIDAGPKRNMANCYRPLLRNASVTLAATISDRTGCSPQTEHLCSPQTTTEPLNLTSDRTSILTAAIDIAGPIDSEMGKREEDSRGREWEATPLSIESPFPAETPQLQAYRLAREHYGERGASLAKPWSYSAKI